MRISHEVRAEAKAQGMREMSEKFRAVGGEIYVPSAEPVSTTENG
jgi:hypothetical protein